MAIQAKVWRVNNNPGISANFSNFTAAQGTATANDTLYFEGSAASYGNIIITKPLVIIGPGYFLSENPQTQANAISAKFGTIGLNVGSAGTTLSGMAVQELITINVSNIAIIRCFTSNITLNSSVTAIGNLLFLDSYINSTISSSGSNTIFNILISNNYISAFYSSVYLGTNASGVISNNILSSDINVSNFTFANNIMRGGSFSTNNNVFYNNIGNSTQFPIGNGNKQNINMTDVFVGATGNSTDGQWQLKLGSPAIGAGNDGTDCGMFGGTTPYVLSGLPQIPSIYEIIMPAAGNNVSGINVTIKAKTH